MARRRKSKHKNAIAATNAGASGHGADSAGAAADDSADSETSAANLSATASESAVATAADTVPDPQPAVVGDLDVAGAADAPPMRVTSGELVVKKEAAQPSLVSLAASGTILVDADVFDAIELDFFKRAEDLYRQQKMETWEDLDPEKAS